MKIFLNETTKHLRRLLVNRGASFGDMEFAEFADGERGFRLLDDVKRLPVGLVASVTPDPGSLFDLLAMYRVLRENGAGERTVFLPYLGYARQDRAERRGEAGVGIMVAELVRNVNASRLIACDIHSSEIKRALGPSVEERSFVPEIASAMRTEPPEVVVAPDQGALTRAEAFAACFDPAPDVAVIDKVRPEPDVAIGRKLKGRVSGKSVLILDDLIDTGGTVAEAVRLVSDAGATSIRVAATHGLFSGNARERLTRLPIREIIVTNTLPQPRTPKIRVLDVTPFILEMLP